MYGQVCDMPWTRTQIRKELHRSKAPHFTDRRPNLYLLFAQDGASFAADVRKKLPIRAPKRFCNGRETQCKVMGVSIP
jgi:hypothetical protein